MSRPRPAPPPRSSPAREVRDRPGGQDDEPREEREQVAGEDEEVGDEGREQEAIGPLVAPERHADPGERQRVERPAEREGKRRDQLVTVGAAVPAERRREVVVAEAPGHRPRQDVLEAERGPHLIQVEEAGRAGREEGRAEGGEADEPERKARPW